MNQDMLIFNCDTIEDINHPKYIERDENLHMEFQVKLFKEYIKLQEYEDICSSIPFLFEIPTQDLIDILNEVENIYNDLIQVSYGKKHRNLSKRLNS